MSATTGPAFFSLFGKTGPVTLSCLGLSLRLFGSHCTETCMTSFASAGVFIKLHL